MYEMNDVFMLKLHRYQHTIILNTALVCKYFADSKYDHNLLHDPTVDS